ncbi:MAG: YggS family pyridoxal phosphate-dependent enzyme [Prevotellaceae bacterium]|jgi:pyridoxal phosphate enzyme (YggS family)|nr:YggS family pyridoxal phosphate-dependent enzyme [Prevotellaceae bacterium]
MSIAQHIARITAELPEGVRLVAVSKYYPLEALREAYQAGQRIFGESRVQELCAKREELPADIEWHFIGHLQSNKIKYIAPFISLIHGVDSEKLLSEIDRQAAQAGRTLNCLLQVYIAREETKFGFSKEELLAFFESGAWRKLQNIRLCGLMGMASNTDDEAQIRHEFHNLKILFDTIKSDFQPDNDSFRELSMGMSGDYPIAIAEGSTLVRIGTAVFTSQGDS